MASHARPSSTKCRLIPYCSLTATSRRVVKSSGVPESANGGDALNDGDENEDYDYDRDEFLIDVDSLTLVTVRARHFSNARLTFHSTTPDEATLARCALRRVLGPDLETTIMAQPLTALGLAPRDAHTGPQRAFTAERTDGARCEIGVAIVDRVVRIDEFMFLEGQVLPFRVERASVVIESLRVLERTTKPFTDGLHVGKPHPARCYCTGSRNAVALAHFSHGLLYRLERESNGSVTGEINTGFVGAKESTKKSQVEDEDILTRHTLGEREPQKAFYK